tara:strand:+ start:798 stop:986 length:189 start_codon:yes stop_codon:yes gene_type:complete
MIKLINTFLIISIFSFLISGCDQITPEVKLRDNYWGKKYLQPDRVSTNIKRDSNGNPILPKQ